jgi:hypothetical protein
MPAGGWQAPQNSNKAIASLVCGVLFMCAPASIAAIILGHLALVDIKRSLGRMAGKGMAIAGLTLGYAGITLTTVYLVFMVFIVRNTFSRNIPANENAAIATMHAYDAALKAYAAKCPAQGYPAALISLGPGRGDCTRANLIQDSHLLAAAPVHKGYLYEYRPGLSGADRVTVFALVARPIVPGGTGKRFFYLDEGGVIRQANSQNIGPNSTPVGTSSMAPGTQGDQERDQAGGQDKP